MFAEAVVKSKDKSVTQRPHAFYNLLELLPGDEQAIVGKAIKLLT
jgi:hypothetical protein